VSAFPERKAALPRCGAGLRRRPSRAAKGRRPRVAPTSSRPRRSPTGQCRFRSAKADNEKKLRTHPLCVAVRSANGAPFLPMVTPNRRSFRGAKGDSARIRHRSLTPPQPRSRRSPPPCPADELALPHDWRQPVHRAIGLALRSDRIRLDSQRLQYSSVLYICSNIGPPCGGVWGEVIGRRHR
jgi:hypothetical protein